MKPSVLLSLGLKFHSPLPLTPRESQQLLFLLTSSFRKHLNQEYPSPRKTEQHQDSESGPTIERSYGSIQEPQNLSSSWVPDLMSTRAANQHFQSILSSPLLAGPERRGSLSSRRRSEHGWQGNIQDARRLVIDPMGAFEESVAAGTATFQLATVCLKNHRAEILRSPALSVRGAMAESGAGSKVMNWLLSRGLIDFKVVENAELADALMPFLAAEGRWHIYFRYMEKLVPLEVDMDGSLSLQLGEVACRIGVLLSKLVASEIRYGKGCNEALRIFERAASFGYNNPGPVLRERISKSNFTHTLLLPAGRLLYSHMVNPTRKEHPSTKAFDLFVQQTRMLTGNHRLAIAKLLLHHPTTPSADLALEIFKSVKHEQPMGTRKRWARFGLDTARVLLKSEKWEDGAWMLEFLQKAYPEEFGIQNSGNEKEHTPQTPTTSRTYVKLDEQVNMKLLEGLDLNIR